MERQSFNIFSETGPLERVIVHTPGLEMDLVSPDDLDALLFEDILFLSHARKEHQLMCAVFEKIAGSSDAVLQVSDLLNETFFEESARLDFIDQLCRISTQQNFQGYQSDLESLSPDELAKFALTGQSDLPIHALPIPNLMFMRDVAAVTGDHIVLSHPATAARARESIIMRVILAYHPSFRHLSDQVIHLPAGVTFEGGDLLVASEKVIVIGNSERTSFGGIMSIAKHLFAKTDFEHVVMVNLPKRRSCMHLDTVFTFASPDECVAFPPLIDLHGLNNIVSYSRSSSTGDFECSVFHDLRSALNELTGTEHRFTSCGGRNALSQKREQWTDGANFFSIAPGVVIGYERNENTFEEMSQQGYRVVSANGFLSYHETSQYESGEKLAIKLDGYELSRGRGGPRCMTLPLSRGRIR